MNETISATDNSTTTTLDNPTEPNQVINETGANGGQATGAAPTTEIFQGIDPNSLTPKEKAVYNSMLKDYREKTARLSETTKSEVEKATQSYRSKAELYDQIATQEEFVKQWNDYVQQVQQTQQTQPQENGNPSLTQLEKQVKDMDMKLQIAELSQIADSFATAVDEKGEKIHPDFDELNTISIGKINGKDDFSLLRGCVELAQGNTPVEKLANGYKNAKSIRDAIYEQGRKDGLGRLGKKILNGTNPPSISTGDALSLTEKKPKNAREALEMARRGQVVSRD